MKKIFLGLLFIFLSQSLQARYYDPDMGRFASRDPLQYIDGMNLYAGYFAQHMQMDPSGREFVFEHIDKKKIKESIDKYNKLVEGSADYKPLDYPNDEKIKDSQKRIDDYKSFNTRT